MSSFHTELAEAKKFISQATQPGIKALLQEYVLNIEETLTKMKMATASSVSNPQHNASSSSSSSSNPSIKQVTISSYSWDETETEVKLYLKLPAAASSSSPIEKIIVSVNSNMDEKSLKIAFAVFFSPSKESSNNEKEDDNDDNNKRPSQLITSGELHSFVAQPTKHELENLVGLYDIPRQESTSASDSSSPSHFFFATPNFSFVYPGEVTTSGGNLLRNCRLKVKQNGDVVIGIKKVMPQIWADLIDKDDFNKPLAFGGSGDGKSRNDPNVQQSASLVSLMQQLYRDGDDEMRKTIANAWEESRSMPPPQDDDTLAVAAELRQKMNATTSLAIGEKKK